MYITTHTTLNYLKMNYETVNVKFKVFWQFKEVPNLKVTKCKKIINCRTGNILKQHSRGFYVQNRYIKRSELNKHIEKITKVQLPF